MWASSVSQRPSRRAIIRRVVASQPKRYVVVVKSPSDDTEIVGPFNFDAASSFAEKLGDAAHVAPLRRPLVQPSRYVVVVTSPSTEIVGPFTPETASAFAEKLGDAAHVAPLRGPAISEATSFVSGIEVRNWDYPRPTDDDDDGVA
jgi:hypothetical protein